MSLIEWKDSFSVGVKAIDDDHKKLISLVNELHDGILAGHSREALGPVLDKLVSYTKTHFKREEDFFTRTRYPGTDAHKKEHDELLQKAGELQQRYKGGATSMLSLETMSFLKNWLSHHISGSDKAYQAHLNAHGIH